jgi:hypothetical protein
VEDEGREHHPLVISSPQPNVRTVSTPRRTRHCRESWHIMLWHIMLWQWNSRTKPAPLWNYIVARSLGLPRLLFMPQTGIDLNLSPSDSVPEAREVEDVEQAVHFFIARGDFIRRSQNSHAERRANRTPGNFELQGTDSSKGPPLVLAPSIRFGRRFPGHRHSMPRNLGSR